jgi:glycosyltransferase involved in cell wall biosynthesis
VRSATAAGYRPGHPDGAVDVVVLLGSRWSDLARHNTRWRRVIERWRDDPRVASITIVDFPRFRRRALLEGDTALARPAESWLDGVTVIDATVPTRDRPGRLDPLAWWRTGRAVRRHLVPTDGRARLVVAATPLWAPLLRHLDATWTHFDAVDDWRAYEGQAHRRQRIEQGYRTVADDRRTTATAVSPTLADRMRADVGLDATAVPNGVDVERFRAGGPAPAGLPDGPFAVYVGVVEARVDLDLVVATAQAITAAETGAVVVAGPVTADIRRRLAHAGVVCLGPIDPDEVPGLLQRATVALLPHRVDGLTASMDPLKLLEYLAAGLPVVSTAVQLPSDVAADDIHVAHAPAAFVAAVLRLLADPPPRGDGTAVAHRRWAVVADTILAVALGTGTAAALPSHQELSR